MAIKPNAIAFEFVGFGERAESGLEGKNRLYLDVGNDLRAGVIDHHHLAAYSGSTCSLVIAHPELIDDALPPARAADAPVTIVLHGDPDLDAVSSACMAVSYLTTGSFPAGADGLARYVDKIDGGYLGATQENPFSLYAAYMQIANRIASRRWPSKADMWRMCVAEGIEVVDFAVAQSDQQGKSLLEIDVFACPGLFNRRDRDDVLADIEQYHRKLADPAVHARQVKLRLPCQFGGAAEVDALLVRNVQNSDDPDRCIFFKDWARTDTERSPGKKGFVALSVFMSGTSTAKARCILSVKPDAGVHLRGLGARLDQAESEERVRLHGFDDRKEDPGTRQPKPPRPGYGNADPWYDGRGHGYTIVDSPRSGTVLSVEKIEEIFIAFGCRKEADIELVKLPSVEQQSPSPEAMESTLKQMTLAAQSWQQSEKAVAEAQPPDIFISYPRKKLAWVKEHVYEPLKGWRGPRQVYFDMQTLETGAGWLAHLADGVAKCRAFVSIYCDEYFQSDFCMWELQLALVRDPLGRKRIVVPLLLDPKVVLPTYCQLIQAHDATRGDIKTDLVKLLETILESH